MSDVPDLSRFGEYGTLFAAVVALVFALAKLPLAVEMLREVMPRRMRWLAKASELAPPDGDFGVHAALQAEIESSIAHGLSGMRLSPAEFQLLAHLVDEHPRDAAWSTIREWSDDIRFVDGRPELTTHAFFRGVNWAMALLGLATSMSGLILLAFVLALMGIERSLSAPLLQTLVATLGMVLVGVVVLRIGQSPLRWKRLNTVFEASRRDDISG